MKEAEKTIEELNAEASKNAKKAQRKFRRECRLTAYGSRMVKAWRVPGTAEHGRDHMYDVVISGK